jgi:hypothetical protein
MMVVVAFAIRRYLRPKKYRWSLRTMFLLVVLAALAVWSYQKTHRVSVINGSLTWWEVRAICQVANASSATKDEPVLSIEIILPNEVWVTTGAIHDPRNGHTLRLNKSGKQWTVQAIEAYPLGHGQGIM